MPTSNYAGFELKVDTGDGLPHYLPSETVQVWDIEGADPETGVGAIALPDITSDSDGHVAGGTVSVAAGRRLRFRWTRDADGKCVSDTLVTT
jgi:hypothetical protein